MTIFTSVFLGCMDHPTRVTQPIASKRSNLPLPPQLGTVSRGKGRERGSERNEMDGGAAEIPDDTRRRLGGNLCV